MNTETIEKASKENASTHFGLINKEWWARKNGFEDGARWRINSVWHDKHTVIPEVGLTALLELKDPNTHKIVYKIDTYCGEEWRGLTHYEHSGLVRFAYLDDLLPQGNEEIEIKKDSVISVYNTARNTNDYGTLHALETLFGIDFFKPKDVKERIKTFDVSIGNSGGTL